MAKKREILEEVEYCHKINQSFFKVPYAKLNTIQRQFLKHVNAFLSMKKAVFESYYEYFVIKNGYNIDRFYKEISDDVSLSNLSFKIKEIYDKTIKKQKKKK